MVYVSQAKFHRVLQIRARFGMDNITFDLPVVQDDTGPTLEFECLDRDANVVDLTGKTVKFYMKKGGFLGSTVNPSPNCVVTDAANGKAQYTFSAGDLAEPGTYFGDLVIEDSQTETAFDVVRLVVRQSNK